MRAAGGSGILSPLRSVFPAMTRPDRFFDSDFLVDLGGELVDRLGVGVDDGAHVDAPSALSGRPATERHTEGRPLIPRRVT